MEWAAFGSAKLRATWFSWPRLISFRDPPFSFPIVSVAHHRRYSVFGCHVPFNQVLWTSVLFFFPVRPRGLFPKFAVPHTCLQNLQTFAPPSRFALCLVIHFFTSCTSVWSFSIEIWFLSSRVVPFFGTSSFLPSFPFFCLPSAFLHVAMKSFGRVPVLLFFQPRTWTFRITACLLFLQILFLRKDVPPF